MKKLLLVSVAWAALFAGPALAADLAPVPVVLEPVFTWTGFYAGLSAGGRWSNVTWETLAVGLAPGLSPDPTTTPVSFKNSTARLGGYLGYDWQFGPQWLFGLEAYSPGANPGRLTGAARGTFGPPSQPAPPPPPGVDTSGVKQRGDQTVRA